MAKNKENVIECGVEIVELKLKNKVWTLKLDLATVLPESFRQYKVKLEFNDQPYREEIQELEQSLDGTLFQGEEISKADIKKRIKAVEKRLDETKEKCEVIEFPAVVSELKYGDSNTVVTMGILDNVVELFNRQKNNFRLYKAVLEPNN